MNLRKLSASYLARLAMPAVIGAVAAVPAHAAYRVTAFENALGYDRIAAEQYTEAASRLSSAGYADQRYAVMTNLCVSQLKTEAVREALGSCERALRAASVDLASPLMTSARRRADLLTHLYSNRGVVKAVAGDLYGARADFEQALMLDPNNANARSNLDRVAASEVAQQSN